MSDHRQYRAFISYSHDDQQWADWLQRRLETFRAPGSGWVPFTGARPLSPVFRDRSDFSSSSDLTAAARQALDNSDALVVICSPAAARSTWVNEEVLTFKKRGGEARIFPLIVSGCPFAEDVEDECFPAALKQRFDQHGQFTGEVVEPLGADVRADADGRSDAFLKVAAGLLDVPFDQLRRRQQARRNRQMLLAASASIVIAAAMSVLAINAYFARQDADLRRAQAEDLIGFMLGDLRQRLEPVGRLDVLDEVGNRAMDYFDSLPEDEFATDAALPRAMALRQIGEVRNAQGQRDAAEAAFLESRRILTLADKRQPDNPDVLFELAQAHFWVADIHYNQRDFGAARREIAVYRDISADLSTTYPDNEDFKLEYAYAASNLATLNHQIGDYQRAREGFLNVVDIVTELRRDKPGDEKLIEELAGTYSWLVSTELKLHELDKSLEIARQLLELRRQVGKQTDKRSMRRLGAALEIAAGAYFRLGMTEQAAMADQEAGEIYADLTEHDPSNVAWRSRLASGMCRRARDSLALTDLAAAGELLRGASAIIAEIQAGSDKEGDIRDLWQGCRLHVANHRRLTGDGPGSAELLHVLLAELDADFELSGLATTARLHAAGSYLLAEALLQTGNIDAARAAALRALEIVERFDEPDIDLLASEFALRRIVGEGDAEVLEGLLSAGFKQPMYWSNSPAASAIAASY